MFPFLVNNAGKLPLEQVESYLAKASMSPEVITTLVYLEGAKVHFAFLRPYEGKPQLINDPEMPGVKQTIDAFINSHPIGTKILLAEIPYSSWMKMVTWVEGSSQKSFESLHRACKTLPTLPPINYPATPTSMEFD